MKKIITTLLITSLLVAVATAGAVLRVPTNPLEVHRDSKGGYRLTCHPQTSYDACTTNLSAQRARYIEAGGLLVITLIGAAGVVALTATKRTP